MPQSPLQWAERAKEKRARILVDVPAQFVHPELLFSDTEAQDALDLPTFSATNPKRVQAVPAQLLSATELAITSMTADQIPPAIAAGTYTALQVLDAFTHRAVVAHQLLHCCLAFLYPAAATRARALDRAFSRTGKLVGPLHGVPVSLKDQCRVAGTETTCGYVARLGILDEEDCLLVKILQNAGAVPFCKTTLSVGCLWGESINNIVGRASNPYNRVLTCGGSSGGEGALLGFRGSPLGVGSDLGGSIRTPSSFNGLHSLRPSSARVPYWGILNSMEGQEIIPSVVGPMARSTAALRLFMKTVIDSQPWLGDPKGIPLPWRQGRADEVRQRPLRLAVMHFDGVILPQPPIRRALRVLEARLRAAGHEVVPMIDIDANRADRLGTAVVTIDADEDVQRSRDTSGEPKLAMLPPAPGSGVTPSPARPKTLLESWDLTMECNAYRARILNAWAASAATTKDGAPIDAYITAVNPSVGHVHGQFGRVRYKGYCAVANVLDLSACTLPVSTVGDAATDPPDRSDTEDGHGLVIPAPTCDKDRWTRENYVRYREEMDGLPVVLQIVAPKYEEERVLAISQILEDLVKGI